MEEDERITIIVERDKYLYSFIIMIDDIDLSFDGKLTFVATNEHGHDEAIALINVKGIVCLVSQKIVFVNFRTT